MFPRTLLLLAAVAAGCNAQDGEETTMGRHKRQATKECLCNEILNPSTNLCECKLGFEKYTNGTCLPVCVAGRVRKGDICVCASGYEMVAEVCVPECPCNMHREPHGCVCDEGFELWSGNNSCLAVCNANQLRTTSGVCSCKASFKLDSYGNCVPACGFRSLWNGTVCVCEPHAIPVTANDYSVCHYPICNNGHFEDSYGCKCNDGYRESASRTYCSSICGANTYWSDGVCICDSSYMTRVDNVSCSIPNCGNGDFFPDRGCVCHAGYKADASKLRCSEIICGAFTRLVGDSCVCEAFYVPSTIEGTCQQPSCGGHGTWSASSGCMCNAGYQVNADKTMCTAICGVNTYWNVDKCTCVSPYMIQNSPNTCMYSNCSSNGFFNATVGCICNNGFVRDVSGRYCNLLVCGDNAMVAGNSCVCKPFFETIIVNGVSSCVRPICDDWNESRGCICPYGYVVNPARTACSAICSSFATWDSESSSCQCNSIYYNKIDNVTCAEATCSGHGTFNLSHGCICDAGYVHDSTKKLCEAVVCGNHAHVSGNGCACDDHYVSTNPPVNSVCRQPNCTYGLFDATKGCTCDASWSYNVITESCLLSCGINELADYNLRRCVCKPFYAATTINGITSCVQPSCADWNDSRGCHCGYGHVPNPTYTACLAICSSLATWDSVSSACQCDSVFYNKIDNVTCAEPTCSGHGSFNLTHGCICDAGYAQDSTKKLCEAVVCGAHSHVSGNGCACDLNYVSTNAPVNSICRAANCTYGTLEATGACTCVSGWLYNSVSEACYLPCGTNEDADYNLRKCVCKPFYENVDNTGCKPMTCNYGTFVEGLGCSCTVDYSKDANGRCTVRKCPMSGHFNTTINTCTCPTNFTYVPNNNTCLSVTCPRGQALNVATFTCGDCPQREHAVGGVCVCNEYYARDAAGICQLIPIQPEPDCTPFGRLWYYDGQKCTVCPQKQARIGNQCIECLSTQVPDVGRCLDCIGGTVPNYLTNECVAPIPSNCTGIGMYLNGVNCVFCGPGQAYFNNQCNVCPSTAVPAIGLCRECSGGTIPNLVTNECVAPIPSDCSGIGRYWDGSKCIYCGERQAYFNNQCNECPSTHVPRVGFCELCADGLVPDYSTNTCLPPRLTCASFEDMPGELRPCYCEERTNGRLTTNGLCRRKGQSICPGGYLDVLGICAGSNQVVSVTRDVCLTRMRFVKSGICVANEMLVSGAYMPTASASGKDDLLCGSLLSTDGGSCKRNAYNVSIRTGLRSSQVVYFNSVDQPCFIGDCVIQESEKQVTWCSPQQNWNFPNCNHDTGFGWTRTNLITGCTKSAWKEPSSTCRDPQSIEVSGSGGRKCFGYVTGGIVSKILDQWVTYAGGAAMTGFAFDEFYWLLLPRVVIHPGTWIPERRTGIEIIPPIYAP